MSSKSNDKQELSQTNSISQELGQQLEATPESDEEEIPTNTAALSLGIRVQKKLLNKLSSKSVAKIFINETNGRILDNLHRLACNYSGKKDADKLRKSIIKSIAKMGILYKNDLLSDLELKLIDEFRNRFHSLVKSIIISNEVDFKFDRSALTPMCKERQD
ncbi:unnamed protein product [Rotaria sordida]|uniref:Uncharacterized protein n=1 Tax=Rotaria sordida TaxID=392033 RepID=A0A819MUZ0_9BILA|nr:unnamed protein product [Rotaria sordida]CAF3985799.1 unnamed protein product [Rotaria sordida]